MFDTYHTGTVRETAVPYARTITEHKAPTDDSIRLYHEFVQKAQKSTIDSFKISNTVIDIAVTVSQNWASVGEIILYKCSLNGEEIFGKINTNCRFESREEVTQLVVEDISTTIARYMFKHLCITTPEYRKYL